MDEKKKKKIVDGITTNFLSIWLFFLAMSGPLMTIFFVYLAMTSKINVFNSTVGLIVSGVSLTVSALAFMSKPVRKMFSAIGKRAKERRADKKAYKERMKEISLSSKKSTVKSVAATKDTGNYIMPDTKLEELKQTLKTKDETKEQTEAKEKAAKEKAEKDKKAEEERIRLEKEKIAKEKEDAKKAKEEAKKAKEEADKKAEAKKGVVASMVMGGDSKKAGKGAPKADSKGKEK